MAHRMKAYEIGPQDGLSGLRLVDRVAAIRGPGEILVKPCLACLNHRDLLILKGQYGALRPEARIPLSDGVGEIMALGEGSTGLAIGDRIIAPHFATWLDGSFSPSVFGADIGASADGWLAEQLALPASAAIKLPASISDRSAATLAAAGTTVWHALVSFGQIKPGDTVLTLGTGGVSIFALQIAKALGARVAITSSNDDKLASCRALGADITINYRAAPDWAGALIAQTDGKGADIIIETAGYENLGQSIAAAAVNGRIALIGALAGQPGASLPNFGGIIGKNLVLKGITSGSRAMLCDLVNLVATSGLEPVVDRVFPFDDAALAYAHLEGGGHLGKVMISV